MRFLILFILILTLGYAHAQTYSDYLGAGQYIGVTSSSSNEKVDNLALNKPSTQSSDWNNGALPASNANDGDTLTINATLSNANAWWEVDLGGIDDITTIEVLNRVDACCSGRLNNFHVLVSDLPFISPDLNTVLNQEGVSNYFTATAMDINTIQVNRTGRYVRVQLAGTEILNVREVRVLGTSPNATINAVNGTDRIPDMAEASRFLSQATMGYNYEQVEYVNQVGIDTWLEEQFNTPHTSYYDAYEILYDSIVVWAQEDDRRGMYLNFIFYDMLFNQPDFLRQKIAFTLSQIFVMGVSDLRGDGTASYYDILYQGAFGNFRDLLYDVSLHHAMGLYLSSYQNSKPNAGLGRQPDENYAREIMQLFSIGVYELNNDGTLKLDANGVPIESYDNEDIKELARVFTGLGPRKRMDGTDAEYQVNGFIIQHHVPMRMYEGHHDTNEKIMVDGTVLPPGQTGLEDINDAVDALFNHPNVGPFIGHQLIQQLVKSNPSPEYINRVAKVFNNNGQGVRGDMEAVLKTVLLDPEARNCDVLNDPRAGKLIQPMERITNLCMAFDVNTPSGRYWLDDHRDYFNKTEQSFLGSPTVFNFFRPDFAESLIIEPNDMVSPEFQILNTTSGIHYINIIEKAIKVRAFDNSTRIYNTWFYPNNDDSPTLDFTDEINIFNSQGITALLDRLDILLCRGQLSANMRTTIENTIAQYQANVPGYSNEDAVEDVIYFIMISPDYVIRR